jgi:hypothetical protein
MEENRGGEREREKKGRQRGKITVAGTSIPKSNTHQNE